MTTTHIIQIKFCIIIYTSILHIYIPQKLYKKPSRDKSVLCPSLVKQLSINI